MPKKSFIEEELTREAKERAKFQKPSVRQRSDSRQQEKRKKQIETLKMAEKYGLVLTPNEMRIHYGYPTISDKPQCAEIVILKKVE